MRGTHALIALHRHFDMQREYVAQDPSQNLKYKADPPIKLEHIDEFSVHRKIIDVNNEYDSCEERQHFEHPHLSWRKAWRRKKR